MTVKRALAGGIAFVIAAFGLWKGPERPAAEDPHVTSAATVAAAPASHEGAYAARRYDAAPIVITSRESVETPTVKAAAIEAMRIGGPEGAQDDAASDPAPALPVPERLESAHAVPVPSPGPRAHRGEGASDDEGADDAPILPAQIGSNAP